MNFSACLKLNEDPISVEYRTRLDASLLEGDNLKRFPLSLGCTLAINSSGGYGSRL
jgi:hypothetical protein